MINFHKVENAKFVVVVYFVEGENAPQDNSSFWQCFALKTKLKSDV